MMDLAELDRRVARLEDVEAITKLKALYCEICDDGHNPDRMIELFTEDGTWEGNGFAATGRDDLHALFKSFQGMVGATQHTAVNPVIDVDVDGDRARAIWTHIGYFLINDTAQRQLLAARYEDHCVKVDGRWRYDRVRVELRVSMELSSGVSGSPQPEWLDSQR